MFGKYSPPYPPASASFAPAQQNITFKSKRWEIVYLLKKELEQFDSTDKMRGLQWEASFVKMKFLMKQLEEENE